MGLVLDHLRRIKLNKIKSCRVLQMMEKEYRMMNHTQRKDKAIQTSTYQTAVKITQTLVLNLQRQESAPLFDLKKNANPLAKIALIIAQSRQLQKTKLQKHMHLRSLKTQKTSGHQRPKALTNPQIQGAGVQKFTKTPEKRLLSSRLEINLRLKVLQLITKPQIS